MASKLLTIPVILLFFSALNVAAQEYQETLGIKTSNMTELPKQKAEIHVKALNKITAKTDNLVLQTDKPLLWNSLKITARTCYKSEAFEAEETAAFLEIDDMKHNNQPQFVFSGWMFASSPAISAMDHALYDVWLEKCTVAETADKP